ncbi:LETM1 domain-containing protein 1 [Oryzias melastigma]|uniref:LETM1 domain-containing protein 1 n=1 Tax=Oryzias melastigma TaxID=30732 RepID=A0A834C6E1_ORYME|nr:LETM1 domain-containing protein 1 [Oryzias melastigma]
MALSCLRMCHRLSSVRLSGIGTSSSIPSLYLSGLSQQSRSPLCRHYTSSKVRRGLGRFISSRLQAANIKYESFLKKRFPRFFLLYHTFMEGFKMLFHDAKEVKRINMKMLYGGVKYQDLPYREMEKLRQFRRDLIKGIPLVMISIPPFANYLVFVLMYFFPRQLLIPHFWNPKQQIEFRSVYHSIRAQHHRLVLQELEDASRLVKNVQAQTCLKSLCDNVNRGANPHVSDILAVRSLFSGPPLGIRRLRVDQMRHISPLLFLTPHLPSFLLGRRLNRHGLELLQLDRALSRLGLHQLNESELRQACYVRGINAYCLGANQCREWLSRWLQVSSSLKDSEVSLLLHCIVFLSTNYPNSPHRC